MRDALSNVKHGRSFRTTWSINRQSFDYKLSIVKISQDNNGHKSKHMTTLIFSYIFILSTRDALLRCFTLDNPNYLFPQSIATIINCFMVCNLVCARWCKLTHARSIEHGSKLGESKTRTYLCNLSRPSQQPQDSSLPTFILYRLP